MMIPKEAAKQYLLKLHNHPSTKLLDDDLIEIACGIFKKESQKQEAAEALRQMDNGNE